MKEKKPVFFRLEDFVPSLRKAVEEHHHHPQPSGAGGLRSVGLVETDTSCFFGTSWFFGQRGKMECLEPGHNVSKDDTNRTLFGIPVIEESRLA